MDYETELKALKDAQNRIAQEQLGMQKNNQLGQIATQEAELKPKYQQERNKATAGSQLQAKSFAEFLANRGGTYSGLAGQGEINRQNLLNTNIGAIDLAQQGAENQLQQARTGVEQDYAQQLASTQGKNELNYLNSMFDVNQSKANAVQKATTARTSVAGTVATAKPIQGAAPYGTIENANGDGKGNVIYTVGGQQYQVKQGYNPFTGTKNTDIKDGTFSNGYQPNNIAGVSLKNAKKTIAVNGQTQNVWTDGGKYYFWDGTNNKYWELTKDEKKALGLK